YNYLKHPEFKKTVKKNEESIWKTTKTSNGVVLSINQDHPLIKEVSNEIPSNTLKSLLNAIAKSLPVSMIQSQEITTVTYSEKEHLEMMEKVYIKLKQTDLMLSEIKKKMVSMEPFKYNKNILIDFYDRIEG